MRHTTVQPRTDLKQLFLSERWHLEGRQISIPCPSLRVSALHESLECTWSRI